jgi:hypothetical protein
MKSLARGISVHDSNDWLVELVDRYRLLIFIPALVAWILGARAGLRRRSLIKSGLTPSDAPLGKVGWYVFVFIACIALGGSAIDFVAGRARGEINTYLQDLSGAIVSVDGHSVGNPAAILASLKSIMPMNYKHTHTTRKFPVHISSKKGLLVLTLGRDSDEPHEYWVFYPKYDTTADAGRVGIINTTAFDGY